MNALWVKTPVEAKLREAKSVAGAGVGRLATYGVESDMSVILLAAAVLGAVAPEK